MPESEPCYYRPWEAARDGSGTRGPDPGETQADICSSWVWSVPVWGFAGSGEKTVDGRYACLFFCLPFNNKKQSVSPK